MYIINAFVLCLVIDFSVSVKGLSLPSYIKACKAREPTIKECAIRNGNAAIPTLIKGDKVYGIPNLNPLVIPLVTATGFGGLSLNSTNLTISGIPTAKIVDAGIDISKQTIFIVTVNDILTLDSDYTISGKIVSLPIEGKGRSKIELYGVRIDYSWNYDSKVKDGKHYMGMKNENATVNPQKMTFHFGNLFNGNEKLGDHMNNFLNENWREVLAEVQPAISGVVGNVVKSIVGHLFSKIPLEEIFPDY